MRLLFILFSMMLYSFLVMCSNAGDLIPEHEMADLLCDIAIGEAQAETLYMKDTSLNKDSVLQKELDLVLALHHVNSIQFSKSYNHYTKDPLRFKVIIDSANERMVRKRDQAYSPVIQPNK